MKSINFLAAITLFLVFSGFTGTNSKWFTKNGHIDFYSHTSMEDIKAKNDNVISVFESETGKIEFKVPVNSFIFEKSLMQEHFNENYMESTKYPDAKFLGVITNPSDLNLNKDGVYQVSAKGKLTMHGQTNDVLANGTFTLNENILTLTSKFIVNPEDYKISIPSAVKEKIAKSIEINVKCSYSKLGI